MSDERSALLQNGEPNARSYADSEGEEDHRTTNGEHSSAAQDIEDNLVSDAPKTSLLAVVPPLALGVFLCALDTTIVVTTYASIGSEMNQLQNTSWIATSYMLSLTCFQPLYGKMSDIFGRKACLIFAYTIFGIGSLLCGMAQNLGQLTVARAFAGIGGGGVQTLGSIIMSDLVPLRQRGTWQGIMNLIWATGQSTGAPLGGLLADTIGWRWAFIIQSPAAFLAGIIVIFTLHLKTNDRSHFLVKLKRVDFLGAFFTILSTLTLLVALDRGSNVAWSAPITLGAFAACLLLTSILAYVETHIATEPALPKRILASAGLLPAFLVNFFTTAGSLCIVYTIPLYLQAVRGMSARRTGMWILPSVAGGVSGSLAGGLIMQRTGKYWALTIVMSVMALVSIAGIGLMTGWWVQNVPGMAICFAAASIGYGGVITTTLIAIIANAGPQDQAIATAVSYLFRSLGSVVGVSGSSAIIQSVLRKQLWLELPGEDIDEIVRRVRESLDYVKQLDPVTRAAVRSAYLVAIQNAWWFSLATGSAVVVCTIFIRETPLPSKKP